MLFLKNVVGVLCCNLIDIVYYVFFGLYCGWKIVLYVMMLVVFGGLFVVFGFVWFDYCW